MKENQEFSAGEVKGDKFFMKNKFKQEIVNYLPEIAGNEFPEEFLNSFLDYFYFKKKFPLKKFLKSFERLILIMFLFKCNGSQKKAAKLLGLKITTLHEKIKKHNIRFYKHPVIVNKNQ